MTTTFTTATAAATKHNTASAVNVVVVTASTRHGSQTTVIAAPRTPRQSVSSHSSLHAGRNAGKFFTSSTTRALTTGVPTDRRAASLTIPSYLYSPARARMGSAFDWPVLATYLSGFNTLTTSLTTSLPKLPGIDPGWRQGSTRKWNIKQGPRDGVHWRLCGKTLAESCRAFCCRVYRLKTVQQGFINTF